MCRARVQKEQMRNDDKREQVLSEEEDDSQLGLTESSTTTMMPLDLLPSSPLASRKKRGIQSREDSHGASFTLNDYPPTTAKTRGSDVSTSGYRKFSRNGVTRL